MSKDKIKTPMHNIESFGTATLGKRGQVVIPAEMREKLNLEQGEQFMVLLVNDSVVFVPGDEFEKMVSHLDEKVSKLKELKQEQ
ncbi:MAG: AbrB/MazE/SpoVT family DNA-binding domain-containing protein [Candidatus Paceibacterota bacterium]